jgi:formylmethanofuran dehydrogenase subunit E
MKTLSEYLELAAVAHGHLCAGQVLGVRLAMLGLRELGILDPVAERKRIVTYVEIDRCVTDAVALVSHCRLGKRALKFRDWGKVAATFVDLQTGRAVRIAAKESSKQAAREMFPEMTKDAGQQKAYAALPDEILFDKQWVRVEVQPEDLPGFKGPRMVCAECGEGINFKREVVVGDRTLCRSCAGERYYKNPEGERIDAKNAKYKTGAAPMQAYEFWRERDNTGTTLCRAEDVKDLLSRGLMGEEPVFCHHIEAATMEEAASIFHLRTGREPYRPEGEPAPCPNGCGAMFYPKGSGQCPNCGQIC